MREYREAREVGVETRPVVVGPVTFLLLAKPAAGAPGGLRPLDLLDDLGRAVRPAARRLGRNRFQLGAARRAGVDPGTVRRRVGRDRPRLCTPRLAGRAAEAAGLDLLW
ncbi:hypothetical protein I7331_11160 [Frankia sp. AgB1.8]|nr:hypothetical protein [Frankia sp. AgB1.8]